MLKILQARLQQYVNHELPGVQAGFRKGRGTRDQIANTLYDLNQSKILYDPPPRVMEMKTKVNKWDLLTLKAFAQQRKPETGEKRTLRTGENNSK